MNETVGRLVFRNIKNLDYEMALDMVFKYKWRNVLNKPFKMYVVINRNTSAVVYMGTLFMNEGEYLYVDIEKLLSEDNESRSKLTGIKIFKFLYLRPLMTIRWIYSSQELYK
ncbi:hypothetical protein AX774_g2317 [Zancudomyces culisetae]|uniref:Uncharacterized protein n=1 Tax=Zancudomyces culisetae TaxID=1213189 RepID=A0A1R1PTA7_ZANCU|nr:hypothetical protein AX774_g2317 [Zancudomyces culisetae]|eukprot:OMH84174.1 hypothetical protein AX774_g2317 [Zancudomyces culisetae]